MRRTAIILHGMPSKEEYFDATTPAQSNNHWLPWLQKKLTVNNILAQTIELPEPYEPVYEKWLGVFKQLHVDEDTILIGHSCGAGFLVRWLSENKIYTGKVALVAPFLDPDHDEVKSSFFEFTIDSTLVERTKGVVIFNSTNDDQEIHTSVQQLKETITNIEYVELENRGHFTLGGMKTEKFPELLQWLIN